MSGLGVIPPASFTADTVLLYRFAHNTWTGSWWRDMRWEHVRSWRLFAPPVSRRAARWRHKTDGLRG